MNGRRSRARESGIAILTVCTGNICRSPLAEQLFRARLGDGFELGSAGLHAAVNAPMDEHSAGHSLRLGGNPAGSFGEQIDQAHTQAADLIVTMTRGQRDELVQRYPAAARRTFTLGEFTRLAERISTTGDAQSAADLIVRAGTARSQIQLEDADDVPDPIDGSAELHARVAAQIDDYVTRSVAVLRAAHLQP